MPFPFSEFLYLTPEVFLATLALGLLLGGVVGRRELSAKTAGVVSIVALLITGVLVVLGCGGNQGVILAGLFVADGFGFFWRLVLIGASILSVILAVPFLQGHRVRATEFFALQLLATVGMMLIPSGFHLLSMWISLELMALASYVLAGYFRDQRKSVEAALKYFILGALSSGILLYGVSLLYGATGTLRLDEMGSALSTGVSSPMVTAGWLMLAVGLLFKVAAAPFHVWTPDVYEGAPTPVTAFLATGSKVASFAFLLRVFYQALPVSLDWQVVIAAIAALTMIWGNLAALTQDNVKRMLAYSSVAHAGYILIGVVAASRTGLWASLFYLLAYTLMTAGVFAVVIALERGGYAGETYDDYKGLAARSPGMAAMLLVLLLSLTGIPPTGGFVGKLYLFGAAVESGYAWLAVVGALTSVLSLFYYFGLVVRMYLHDADEATPEPLSSPWLWAAVSLCTAGILLLGLMPEWAIRWAADSLIAY